MLLPGPVNARELDAAVTVVAEGDELAAFDGATVVDVVDGVVDVVDGVVDVVDGVVEVVDGVVEVVDGVAYVVDGVVYVGPPSRGPMLGETLLTVRAGAARWP